jgi:dienelactone hydrolase
MPDRPGWLDEVGKAPAVVPATATRPAPLLLDDEHRPIATADGWKARRAQLVARWRTFLGAIPDSLDLAPHVVLESDRRDGVDRRLIRYEAGPGLPVEAYLLRPLDDAHEPPSRPRPGVVVLHSTIGYTIRQPAGLEGPSDHHLGLHLARRGYVALCPRCFLWQYSERGRIAEAVDWLHQRYPGVTGMSKMLADAMRAVDLLLGFPGVDARRIGAIGHSLGAKEVLYLAAFDPRVRASVSSEGGIGITYSNWDAPWYLGEAARRPGFPLDHGQVLALAAPRAFLLIGGESADGDASWPYIEAVQPVWSLLGAPDAVGLFNHRQGHAIPPQSLSRSVEWLDWFLRP